jgi:hypothetical protein
MLLLLPRSQREEPVGSHLTIRDSRVTLYAVAGASEDGAGFPLSDERRQEMVALSVGIPIVIIAILVFLVIVIFAIRRRR